MSLAEPVNIMFDCVKFMSDRSTIFKKFGHKRFHRVGLFVKQYVADKLVNEIDYFEAIRKINTQ